jgi:hypothetical protein
VRKKGWEADAGVPPRAAHAINHSPGSGLTSTKYAPLAGSLRMLKRSAHKPNSSVLTVKRSLAVASGSGSAAVDAIDSRNARSK